MTKRFEHFLSFFFTDKTKIGQPKLTYGEDAGALIDSHWYAARMKRYPLFVVTDWLSVSCCGRRNCTNDLQLMRLASYYCSIPQCYDLVDL